MLVFENKKMDDHEPIRQIFHSSAKLIVNDSGIDKAFGSMRYEKNNKFC